MSRAYKCDRCGDCFGVKEHLEVPYEVKYIPTTGVETEKTLDLCPRCAHELDEWLANKEMGVSGDE